MRIPLLVRCASGLLFHSSAVFIQCLGYFCGRHHLLSQCVYFSFSAVSLTSGKGLLYLGAPPVFLAFQKWPKFLHRSLIIGLPIVVLAVFLSSFATATWHLILTQGILYAIGGNFLYYPIYVFIDEWFVRRKGLAYGVMWAGSGCGGLAGPLVLNWGLKNYGAETFLRGWAVALVSLPVFHRVCR